MSSSCPAAVTDPETQREAYLAGHLGLVHHVARRLKRGLADEADFAEMVSAGTMGLIHATESFDPSRGHAFSTYAAPRIRGAILDELRRQDTATRGVRRKTRDLGAARDVLTRELGRRPTEREVAAHLGIDLQTLWRWSADAESAVSVRLDAPQRDGDERTPPPAYTLADESARPADEWIAQAEEAALLRDAVLRLKEQERVVLSLYYFEELKLREIAEVLEVTESRVSQIRTRALARLREDLAYLRAA